MIFRYPGFVFLHDPYLTKHVMEKPRRYSKAGLLGVATDLMLLKESDFFIGTYSSNVSQIFIEQLNGSNQKSLLYSWYYAEACNLHGLAPEQNSYERTPQRWLVVGSIASDLTCPGVESKTSRTVSGILHHYTN